MADAHLTHDEFFAKLTDLFEYRRSRDHGAIILTQKRLSHNQDLPAPTQDNPWPDVNPGKALPLIIRATNNKGKKARARKVKLSTVVQPDELAGFYTRYQEVCKGGMTGLKPRDKSKKKAKAKKKKGGAAAAS